MNRLRTVLARLLLLLAWAPSLLCAQFSSADDQNDPAQHWLRGYSMNHDAEEQLKAGNFQGALDLYTQAQGILDNLAKTNPAWNPQMLAYRRGLISDAITQIKAKQMAPPAPPAPSAPGMYPPGSLVGAPALPNPLPSGLAMPGTVTPASPSAPALPGPMAPAAPGATPSFDDYLNGLKAAVAEQMQGLKQQNTELYAKVGQYQLGYETALKQRDEIASNYQTLSATAVSQQAKIKELEGAVAAGAATKAELEASKKALAETNAAMVEAKERQTKLERSIMDQSKQLMESALKLATAERERDTLAKEKAAITTERDAAMKKNTDLTQEKTTALADRDKAAADSKKVATERDALAKERDAISLKLLGLQAQYDQLKKTVPSPAAMATASAEMKALAAENDRLKKALDSAQRQVETLKGDLTRKDQEIAQLKGNLAKLQDEVTTLKKESAAYASQVSDLTLQLKTLKDKADKAQATASAATTGEAALRKQENDLLKGIIKRQLIQQSRQQETKALVIQQLEKMGDQTRTLVDQVEQLGGSRIALSAEEQKLFTTPELKEFLSTGGIQSTFVSKSQAPGASAAKPDPSTAASAVTALLDKGNAALLAGKLNDAATAFQDALRADPKNTDALASLAWTRLQQGSLTEAETTLKKSLALAPDDANAHYMLGVAHYRRNNTTEAQKSFEKSLELSANNAKARHYLGIIANQSGLLERAEREFKTSLAIDPTYAEGYFNLAVLYVTSKPPKWAEAKKNYDEALKRGLKPDANLESILKQQQQQPGAPASAQR